MLYTSYIGNLRNIPENFGRIYICSYMPDSLKLRSGFDLHLPALAPSEELKFLYKREMITFEKFIAKYRNEINSREDIKELISEIKSLSEDMDIVLVCYEKDCTDCHRYFYIEDYNAKEWSV